MVSYDIDGTVEQRYAVVRHIGSGAYGVVWCAVDRYTGKQVAVKKVFDAFGNQQDAQRTYREVMLLTALMSHPRVVTLLNVIRAVNSTDLYLVCELAETDLTVVLRKPIVGNAHRKFIAYQVIRTVAQLHAMNVIHRDLKPSNIFINSSCQITIGDFGLARCIPEKAADDSLHFTDYIATRWYRSPEVLVKSSRYTTAMDMWAIGCIVAELLTGHPFLSGSSTTHQLQLIVEALGEPSEEDLASLKSSEHWPLKRREASKGKEPVLKQLLAGYDALAIDLIEKLLVFNPTKRLTAKLALQHPYVADCVSREDLLELEDMKPLSLPLEDEKLFSPGEYQSNIYELIATKYRHSINP